jgi:hypothetical protein
MIDFSDVIFEMTRPNVLHKPKLYQDGNMWCALLGGNIQEGICGFGKSPAKAMMDFDKAWFKDIDEVKK